MYLLNFTLCDVSYIPSFPNVHKDMISFSLTKLFALYTYGHMFLSTSRYVIDLNMINVLEKSQPELLSSPFHEECFMLVFPVKYAMEVVPVSTSFNSLNVIYDFLSAVWLHEYFTNQAHNCHFKMQNTQQMIRLNI